MSEAGTATRSYEELLRQRRIPSVYIVDDESNVVLSWHGFGDEDLMTGGGATPHLPLRIQQAVGELQRLRAQNPEVNAVPFRLLDESYVIRITPISGSLGFFTAVFIEPFKARDHLRSGILRFQLTRREREVIQLLIEGARTSDIALRLGIAQSTVVLHVKSALAKTHSRSRTEMLGKILAHEGDSGMQRTPR
jgi:DNA-binding CsgD family transcriptional regulator